MEKTNKDTNVIKFEEEGLDFYSRILEALIKIYETQSENG